MKAILLFTIMLITLQVNAQVGTLGYHRYDGTYVSPEYRPYSDGQTYDNWYNDESSTTKRRDISARYSDDYRERSTEQRTTRPEYTQPARTNNSSYDYYPSNSNNSKLTNRDYTNSKQSTYYVTVRSLNIRSGPSTKHQLLGDLYYGESVDIVESYANGWKKIKYTSYDSRTYSFNTKYGYVSGSYLSTSKPYERYNDTRIEYNTYDSNIYTSSKRIESHAGIGGLTIWTNCGTDGGIRVYLDDEYIGTLTQYFTNGVPKCGESGTLFIEKPAGRYKLVAKGDRHTWNNTVIITKNKCLIQGLER